MFLDAGCSLGAVKAAHAALFPLASPLALAAEEEAQEAADDAAVGGAVPATLL